MTDTTGAFAPENLTQLLQALPAKPRVHGVAKVAGVSSKELIALLGARGVSVSSASSSVDRDLAVALLTELLGPDNPPADPGAPKLAEAALATELPVALPAELPAVPAVPAAKPSRPRTKGLDRDTPLFAAPVFQQPTYRADDDRAVSDSPPDAQGTAKKSGGTAKKSGAKKSGAKKSGAKDSEAIEDQPAVDPVAESAAPAAEPVDTADTEDAPDGRRRRRRGRRGRGRVADGETTTEPDTDELPAPEVTEEPVEETDDSASGTSRRRRRRRRRSGSEDGSDLTTDDGDEVTTTVHVRDGRQAASEVQGIRGSTRLEAKRQRRRDSREQRRRPQILTEAEFLARRESVKRVMAVRQRGDTSQVALLEDGVLVEHFVSKSGSASLIGNVYLGRVQNVLPSMEAAFVDIGRGRNAVLYAGEVNWDITGLEGKARRIETALASGDTVLVQVSKDPVGHKGARLTTQISLPGRFLVYVPGGGATGISRKLPDTERKRLKGILDRIVPDGAGVIIRTAAEGVDEEELTRDVQRLTKQWAEIEGKAAQKAAAPTLLSAEPDTLIRVIRDLFNSDITELVIDGADAFPAVSDYVSAVAPELADRLREYDGSGDVFSSYRIDEQIAKALERKVHLPSGGSLVIDRTEAMTVVDVNTGKFTGSGGNLEETVTKNNLEAAEEIVRQLRLRDIGGIIVVDFIDMVLESNRDLVLRRLTECLGRDRTRHQVAEVTSLGLVQMTRKRLGTGLVEAFSDSCQACHGRGIVLSDMPSSPATPAEPARKGRRRAKRSEVTATPAVPIVRIETPPGAKPVLRPGAPIRVGDNADAVAPEAVVDALAEPFAEVVNSTDSVAPEADLPAVTTATAAQVPAAKKPRRRRAAARPAGAPVAEVVAGSAPSVAVVTGGSAPGGTAAGDVAPGDVAPGDVAVAQVAQTAAPTVGAADPGVAAAETSVDVTAPPAAKARARRPRRRAASRPAGPVDQAE